MPAIKTEKQLAKFLAVGSFLVTILVVTGMGTDPVNLPKLSLLGLISFACVGLLGKDLFSIKSYLASFIPVAAILFMVGLTASYLMGSGPGIQNFYGSYGRNTGSLTYFLFLVLLIAAAKLVELSSYIVIIRYFLYAGIINVIYCYWVILTKKDPIPWTNPYGTILGTLGNPDFVSAFLGMVFSAIFCLIFNKKLNYKIRSGLFVLLPLILYLIVRSKAIQGLLVLSIGMLITFYFLIREKFNSRMQLYYLSLVTLLSIFAVAGIFQKGIFSSILYKPSVSIRGAYWRAAFEMFKDSPLWGLGLGSFGDSYKKYRDFKSTIVPGLEVSTDAAHNTLLDFLSGGGLLLTIPYLLILGYCLVVSIRFIKSHKEIDFIFSTIFIVWICYLTQSIVSINQIGLAIWGWVFSGLLLSYSLNYTKTEKSGFANKVSKPSVYELEPAKYLVVIANIVLGGLIACLPQYAEFKWSQAAHAGSAGDLIAAMNQFPQSNMRYLQTSKALAGSGMQPEALEALKRSSKFNPDNLDTWILLSGTSYGVQNQQYIMGQIQRLDPLNKSYLIK